jgi:integrase
MLFDEGSQMTTEDEDRIDVRGDGRIVLYKRKNLKNPKWQARISVPNSTGYKVVTTKTANLEEAKRFALNLHEELYMQVKAGGQLKTRTFKQVHDEWKTYAETHSATRAGGSWGTTIERVDSYALEFFGRKAIGAIREADFTEYWAWRRTNYRKRPPTNSTLKRERTSIMPVFKFAFSKGYINKLPETNTPKVKANRRPTFSKEEWRKIRDASTAWVKEARELATWRDRYMARYCFQFLAYSGLRIGELRNLRWRDISAIEETKAGEEAAYYVGYARGKTGVREFVLQPGAEVILKRLYMYRTKELTEADTEGRNISPDPNHIIFCHPDGQPIREYKHSFQSLLKFAGVPVEVEGGARTIYSLRHFYATQRLSEEGSPYLIARQMGTSVEMLDKHYGQVVNRKLAAEITRRKPSSIVVKGDIKFPF